MRREIDWDTIEPGTRVRHEHEPTWKDDYIFTYIRKSAIDDELFAIITCFNKTRNIDICEISVRKRSIYLDREILFNEKL